MVPRVGCDLASPFLGACTASSAQGSVGDVTASLPLQDVSPFGLSGCSPSPWKSRLWEWYDYQSCACVWQGPCMYPVGRLDAPLQQRPPFLPHVDGAPGTRSAHLPGVCCAPEEPALLRVDKGGGSNAANLGCVRCSGHPVCGAAVGEGDGLSHDGCCPIKEKSSSESPLWGMAPFPNSIQLGGLCAIFSL